MSEWVDEWMREWIIGSRVNGGMDGQGAGKLIYDAKYG